MSKVKHLISSKIEYESKLNMVLKKYFIKYFKELYEDDASLKLRELQKILYKIPSWSDNKIDKEYGYFTKYIYKKYELNQDDLSKILDLVYSLNIKIMTSIYDVVSISIPKFKNFWYKSIKKIAKYFYENPKLIKENTDILEKDTDLENILKYVLQRFIPIEEILHLKKHKEHSYDFEKASFSENENKNEIKIQVNLEKTDITQPIEKNSLIYMSSDEYENEYYKSENNFENEEKIEEKAQEKAEEKAEEKEIKIPKYFFKKKNNYNNFKISNMAKSGKKEEDENFFD